MVTFKDVKIGQTFYNMKGAPMKKISETQAQGTMPEYCGFDWQEVRMPSPSNVPSNASVYGIK